MSYIKSVYSFERCELRTLQNTCNGDNEMFLNLLADMVGKLSAERDAYQDRAHLAEGKLMELSDK